ncbi:MAG TPA: HAMP domain-containing sensor histidine kinase [Solirubrobacteraceae bacterium]|nr:HAMP domain-containing sensor histidine kinase [Solirubrobacteraceae bacterium]
MLSIRNRLAALFFLITAFAVGVVLLYVTPQLRTSLREEKLGTLAETAERYSEPITEAAAEDASTQSLERVVGEAADRAGVRVILLDVELDEDGEPTSAALVADSAQDADLDELQFATGLAAARTGATVTGTEMGAEQRLAEAAKALVADGKLVGVAVFASPADDVEAQVALIRRQILIAGAIALALALIIGVVVARAITQRVRRIERGAEQVAAGDFSARFPTDSPDELGQLARALDDMQRQLAELDSARKRFIATASHELRTPIFSLGGFLELLEEEELDEPTRRAFVRQVRDQVDRLGKLATDLLDLSRLEAGSLELRHEDCDVGLLAEGVTSEFVPALVSHDSRLELRLAGRRLRAACDPERVAQVLRILIDNALTHTPSGTDLVVTAGRWDGRVRLTVRDYGPGIGDEALERVFEPFYTSDGTQGSGLGLAIARELTERMKGSLGVESAPGRTTFTLELPA